MRDLAPAHWIGAGGRGTREHVIGMTQALITPDGPGKVRRLADTALVVLLAAISPAVLIAISICEPYAGKALHLPDSEIIWFAESFMIGTLLVTPVSGALLTRYGFVGLMRVALLGTLVSAAAILASGHLAVDRGQFGVILPMFLLGVFSAPIAPAAQAFVASTLPPALRGKGMAQWAFGRYAGFLLMAAFAGALIDHLGWSVAVAIGALLVLPCLPLLRRPPGLPRDSELRFDGVGLLLMLVALLPALAVFNLGPLMKGESSHLGIAALVLASLVGGFAFVRHARRVVAPIVSLEPLRDRGFAVSLTISLVVAIMTTGQFSILMVSEVAHVSAEWVSWRTAAGGVAQLLGVLAGGALAVPLLARPGTVAALIVTAVGLASFTIYGTTVDLPTICWTRAVMGFGLGLSVPLLAAFAFRGVTEAATSAASALFVFAGMMGTELGLAILAGVLAEVQAATGDALFAYRTVFWIEAVGTLAMIPLVFFLRLDDRSRSACP